VNLLELEIMAPDQVVAQARVVAVQAADASGRFGIRPGHENFLTVLVPCVLRYRTEDGRESYAAVDGGVLLLEDQRLSIVTRDAVIAERLDRVADAAAAMLAARKQKEHTARAGFAELETSLLRELRKAVPRS
jgi:F-type H+-transporting ATPase subunit epsilon